MLDIALSLLKKIESHGFKAYIVGGFVRDNILEIESNDIDICTNAKPSDLHTIFEDSCLPNEDYGSISVIYKNVLFEITTFRKEIKYINNRKPVVFEYIDDLLEDLKRRDFLINTLCMDSNGNIIDLLNGRRDIEKREINTVGDSNYKFTEDSLRILRAIRFATKLDFRLSDEIKSAILETKELVGNLSYERKKEELSKIFTSSHVKYGINLLKELGLDSVLELNNLESFKYSDDLMGVWAQLGVVNLYPFSKNEKEIITSIEKALKLDNLSNDTLYKYGLYINSVSGSIKNIDKKLIADKYSKLPIKSRRDIVIKGNDIINILNIKPSKVIDSIFSDIENKIVNSIISNDYDSIKNYLINTYSTHI